PSEDGCGLVHALPLFAQHPGLAPQPAPFLLLVAREPVAALGFLPIRRFEPPAQPLTRDAQLVGTLAMRVPPTTGQANRLGAELRRRGLPLSRCAGHGHLLGALAPTRQVST